MEFEKKFTKGMKSNFSIMVNSGSSANLLALQCLINPYQKNPLKAGDEVILPTLCWLNVEGFSEYILESDHYQVL